MNVPKELEEIITDLIYEGDWVWRCGGYQNTHDSDLYFEEHYLNDEEKVIQRIVDEVLKHYRIGASSNGG
jgi:hypothetical protein